MARDLLLLGGFAVNTDRAVLDDEPDLGLAREVLEVHDRVVLPDLLDVPLHLLLPGDVAVDPQFLAHVVPDKHGHGLCRPAGTPDRSCIEDHQVLAAVIVLAKGNLCNPFRGCGNDPFGQEGHRNADRMVEDLHRVLLAELPGNKVVADPEGCLLAGHRGFELADPDCNALDPDQDLDTVGKVACNRDLDIERGVKALFPGLFCYRNGAVQFVQEGLLVGLHRGRELEHTGKFCGRGFMGWDYDVKDRWIFQDGGRRSTPRPAPSRPLPGARSRPSARASA